MKTLVPPPITPNWTPGPERVGLLTVETVKDSGKYYEKRNWYVQDDTEATANFRFFGAAPAMAEALVAVWDHYASIDDLSRAEERVFRKVEDALLSAGYTEAADQE